MIKYFFYSTDINEVSTRSRNIINELGGTEQLLDYYKKHNSFLAIQKVGKNANEELVAFCNLLLNLPPNHNLDKKVDKVDETLPVKLRDNMPSAREPLREKVNPGKVLDEFVSGISYKKLAQKYNTSVRSLSRLVKKYNDENYKKTKQLIQEKKASQWQQWHSEFLSLASHLGRTPTKEETMNQLNLSQNKDYGKILRTAFNGGYLPENRSENENRLIKKREAMLAYLKELAGRLGRTPATGDLAKDGKYTSNSIASYFGSFTAAQQLAGLTPNKSGGTRELAVRRGIFVSREMCIEDLKKIHDKLGFKPRWRDVKEHGSYTVPLYVRGLGIDLIDYIDYRPKKKLKREYTPAERQDMLDYLLELAQHLGRTPGNRDINDVKKFNISEYRECFGSFHNAQVLAGLKPTIRNIWNGPKPASIEERKKILLDYLIDLAKKYGHMPGSSEIGGRFSRSIYRFYFGTFANAQKAAAIMNARKQNSLILKSLKS